MPKSFLVEHFKYFGEVEYYVWLGGGGAFVGTLSSICHFVAASHQIHEFPEDDQTAILPSAGSHWIFVICKE